MQKLKFKNQKSLTSGFMLVELLVIAAILVILIISAAAVARKAIEVSNRSLHMTQASFLLEEGIEAVRILRDNDFGNVTAPVSPTNFYLEFTGGTWTKSTTPSNIGIFTRHFNIYTVSRDPNTKDIVDVGGVDDAGTSLITMNVSWVEGGENVTKSVSFYLTNIFE